MKHLRASLVLAIFLATVFGGFIRTEKVFAQTTDKAQVTQADFVALQSIGTDIESYAKTVPPEGFDTGFLDFTGQQMVGIATTLTPAALMLKLTGNTINGVDGSYFKNSYINILTDTYNSTKDTPGTTKNSLGLSALIKYNVFLGDLIFSEKIQTTTGLRSATRQEEEQAYIVLQYVKGQQSIFAAKVKLENNQITTDQKNALVNAAANGIATSAVAAANGRNNPATVLSCTISSWSIGGCLNSILTWFVKNILLEFVGFFLWASANLLNYAMLHGIFEFKKFAPDQIYSIWLVVRQIVSLFVFFAGLFVGFMAIIGKSEDFKKYIAFLVLFGLFVNFSYPVVRVFVDISNVVSLQIYQTTLGDGILANNSNDTAGSRIMAKMGLQDLVMSATAANSGGGVGFKDVITSLPGALAAVGFVGYAAYIFFMAAVLIIVRTALLVCIIIASPILLVDTVVPALGEKAKWLRGMFISQLFVAPVFAIMLALTLKFLDIFNSAGIGGGNTNATLDATASGNNVAVFFNLIMMLVMLHIMLKVTKAVAGGVGETVTKWAGKAGGLGTGMTLGVGAAGLGFAGRQTLGRAGEYLGQQGGIVGDLGRKMAGGKYDLRNLSGTQSLAQTAGITGMGKGADKNRKAAESARDEENAKIAQGIGDDSERELFLRRKFSTGGISGFTGKEPTSKAYKNFTKDEEDVLKKYISADDERRKEMMGDDKNKRFAQRFKTIDSGATSTLSENLQKALSDKLAKDKAADVRNTDRIANYLTANQATRESIYANAVAADDKNLLKQLAVMDKLVTQPAGTITEDAVRALGDEALAQKVLANDLVRAGAQKAQENQATVAQAQAEAQKIIQDAQLSAAQAQKEAAQSTSAALASLAQSQNDLAQQIKNLVTS